jgi:DNA-binding MarR family transcriptional regulator
MKKQCGHLTINLDPSINLAELERDSGLPPARFARVIRRMRLMGYIRRQTPLPDQPAQILAFPSHPRDTVNK